VDGQDRLWVSDAIGQRLMRLAPLVLDQGAP
jgi:hypothetical protein